MSRTIADLAILATAFAAGTALAALFGAANFGTALTFGQIAFVVAVICVILGRRERRNPPKGVRPRLYKGV